MNDEIDVRDILPTINVPTLVLHRARRNLAATELSIHGRAHPGSADGRAARHRSPAVGGRPGVASRRDRAIPCRSAATESSPIGCSPPCSSPTSSGQTRRQPAPAPRSRPSCSHGTAGSCARSWCAFAAARSIPPRTGCSPPSTARPAPSAAPRRSSLPSATSASRGEPASTPARSSGRTRACEESPCNVGVRIAAAARPGEVLVSSTVKDIVAGSGIVFEERGEQELAGVPGTWRLFAAVP